MLSCRLPPSPPGAFHTASLRQLLQCFFLFFCLVCLCAHLWTEDAHAPRAGRGRGRGAQDDCPSDFHCAGSRVAFDSRRSCKFSSSAVLQLAWAKGVCFHKIRGGKTSGMVTSNKKVHLVRAFAWQRVLYCLVETLCAWTKGMLFLFLPF